MERGRERHAATQAVASRRCAERAFGGDVDGVGIGGVDKALDLRTGPPREFDFGVARARARRPGEGSCVSSKGGDASGSVMAGRSRCMRPDRRVDL